MRRWISFPVPRPASLVFRQSFGRRRRWRKEWSVDDLKCRERRRCMQKMGRFGGRERRVSLFSPADCFTPQTRSVSLSPRTYVCKYISPGLRTRGSALIHFVGRIRVRDDAPHDRRLLLHPAVRASPAVAAPNNNLQIL